MPIQSVTVITTADCNLGCEYCYLPKRRPHRAIAPHFGDMLASLLRRADADLSITITGGEPLLEFTRVKDIVAQVLAIRGERPKVEWKLLTNGLLLDAQRLSFLESYDFAVRISFDGVPAAQARRGRNTFARLDALLGTLRQTSNRLFRDRLEIAMVLSPDALDELAPSVEYFLNKDVPALIIAPEMGGADWRLDRITALDEAFARAARAVQRHYERARHVPVVLFRKTQPDAAAPKEWSCGAPLPGHVAIDLDGMVSGCVLGSTTYQEPPADTVPAAVAALRVGRPDDPDFDANLARMSEAARATGAFDHPERRYSSYGRCVDCAYFGRCNVCPLAMAHDRSWADPRRVPDFLCAFNQVSLAHRDRFPVQPSDYDLLTGNVPFPPLQL